MILTKNELTIRNAVSSDAEQLCEWWNDGKVMAHAGFPNGLNTTPEQIRADISTDDDATNRRHIIEFEGKPIGEMNYRNKGDRTAEIGIKICDFSYQDKGLGTKLLYMFIDALFTYFDYNKIILDTNIKNKRAQHVYENKLGFKMLQTRENTWRDQVGELQSFIDYELSKNDWLTWKTGNKAPRQTDNKVRPLSLCDYPEREIQILSLRDCPEREIREIQILSLRDYPERADDCRELLFTQFNEFTSKHPAQTLASKDIFPQGYFMLKNGKVVGWTGLHESEAVSGKVYGWNGSLSKEDVMSEELSPWITPLLVHVNERGNRYGRLLLDFARKEAGRLGFNYVYLTTNHIGYYEKYGFREVGLTMFTWEQPTKVYECDTIG